MSQDQFTQKIVETAKIGQRPTASKPVNQIEMPVGEFSQRPKEATPKAAAPKTEAAAPAAEDHVKGMPSGYEEMTVAQISEGAKTWNRRLLEAALTYEQAHAARKGAISALESALKAKEEDS